MFLLKRFDAMWAEAYPSPQKNFHKIIVKSSIDGPRSEAVVRRRDVQVEKEGRI
jgi:hypothetical protein